MHASHSHPAGRQRPDWWFAIAAAILVVQCAVALPRQGFFLVAYNQISYFLLMLVAAGIAAGNAVRAMQAIRLFWLLLAAGCALWALTTWFWVYAILHARALVVPDLSWSDPPLFLHIVFFMAAVVTRPHLKWPSGKLYHTTLYFLLLLFFWAFIYAFLQLPYRHSGPELFRYTILYFVENIVLLAALGKLVARVQGQWKTIYLNLFGASALYASSSLASNIVTTRYGFASGWYHVPMVAALCWFIWVTLLGRTMAHELEEASQPATDDPHYVSLLAMLSVVAIPLIGLFELFRVDEPPERKSLRLLIAFVSAVVLALSAFIREYLERHDLTADLSTAVLQRTRVEEERLELSGRLIHAQEEERSRIGRELHDDLNQRLGLLAFGLVQLLGSAPAEPKNSIHQLHEQTNNLSKDVHCLSHELHPVALEQLGLVVAARAFCGDFSKQQKMRVEFTEENILAQLAPDVSLCLFRILQESLTNARKHGEASFARVSLTGTPDGIRLIVEDDGMGFDPGHRHRGGLGLLSMQERLRLVRGAFRIDSAPGEGTTVDAWVPIQAAEQPHNAAVSEQQRFLA
jgi:signal transduction histidine kinase